MGAGTNVQRLDCSPSSSRRAVATARYRAAGGPDLRQGNSNKEVQIFRYVTEGSFDAYMWQLTGQSSAPAH
jgi:hypothetical protein